jgi:hypothetical protein
MLSVVLVPHFKTIGNVIKSNLALVTKYDFILMTCSAIKKLQKCSS